MNEGAMWTKATTSVKQNRLLALLPEEELVSIKSRAERVRLRPRQILHHWRSPLEHVYFLTDGLVSVGGNVGRTNTWKRGSSAVKAPSARFFY
ncbi:hypothetical protein AB8Z38_14080 [Bradyrhizobium sp. LLZ17]|uniref:Cyclic nucleotide-binding domain-containing protein n=1 Tax=Bradyrhizobium sp. LLZ17 TaxID=3239388 RepID=A0AB39XYZ9_9BRAD